jgi:PilZ domain
LAATVETLTADLSLGGALLERRQALGDGREWLIELFPSGPSPIRCHAVLARETPTQLGVAFLDMSDSDRIRLAGILADHQRPEAVSQPADR